MALRRRLLQNKVYGGWVREARPPFMRSDAYDLLVNALRRYIRNEIPGHSLLIAGHRGAGKTALVTEAVVSVADQVIGDWESWARERVGRAPRDPPGERQRPLLVKLHGPSLLAPELPNPGGGEAPAKAVAQPATPAMQPVRKWASRSVIEVIVSQPAPAPTATPEAETRNTPTDEAHAALVQITIGLYRALAEEVAVAATARAYEAQDARGGGYLAECAAQLRLDLTQGAGPEKLQAFWQEIEPGMSGILWPSQTSAALAANIVPDQHFREITAVAMAAQAFQVCSGAVTYNQTRRDSAAVERSFETRTGFDSGQAINRMIGLGIGGLAGYGLAGWGGAGIGLAGSVAITAATRRTNRREQGEDYKFIIDRSVQTLERDLPMVIRSIRSAGLAPVFMVDELDKLAPLGAGVTETLRGLLSRLKGLTTDLGFFCFLTDRSYFDEVEAALAIGSYPVEHTYFSDRLLIGYTPQQFDALARDVIEVSPDGDANDAFALYVLTKRMTHDSSLNTIEFHRSLNRGWEADPTGLQLKTNSATLAASQPELIAAAAQIAVEQVLAEDPIASRSARQTAFRQMASDTAYLVARAWNRNESHVDLSAEALARNTLARRGQAEPEKGKAEAALTALIGNSDTDLLKNVAMRLSVLLCDFNAVTAPMDPGRAVFDSLKTRSIPALLRVDGPGRFRFLFPRDGEGDPLSTKQIVELKARAELGSACLKTLSGVGVTSTDLIPFGWPPTIADATITLAIEQVLMAARLDELQSARSAAGPLEEFIKFLDERRQVIGNAISLAADIAGAIRADGSPTPALAAILATIPRHAPDVARALAVDVLTDVIMPGEAGDFVGRPAPFPVTADTTLMKAWQDEIRIRAFGQ